jgi:hypothetical protein
MRMRKEEQDRQWLLDRMHDVPLDPSAEVDTVSVKAITTLDNVFSCSYEYIKDMLGASRIAQGLKAPSLLLISLSAP